MGREGEGYEHLLVIGSLLALVWLAGHFGWLLEGLPPASTDLRAACPPKPSPRVSLLATSSPQQAPAAASMPVSTSGPGGASRSKAKTAGRRTISGKVVQTFPIGAGVDTNIFEPSTGMLFVAAREGMLHVFHEDSPDKFSVVETVKTEFGARNMALDPKTHQLFIDTADFTPAPEPTTEQPHPQPTPVSGTFRLLVYGR